MSGLSLARSMFQAKVRGVLDVSEAMGNGDWFRARLTVDPTVVIEIGYDDAGKKLPGTHISYMGAWRGNRGLPLMEFQNGFLAYHPDADAWDRLFRPVVERLIGHRPMRVAGDARNVSVPVASINARQTRHFSSSNGRTEAL